MIRSYDELWRCSDSGPLRATVAQIGLEAIRVHSYQRRPTDVPDTGLICDLLWADPDKDSQRVCKLLRESQGWYTSCRTPAWAAGLARRVILLP